jgi:hypothetical protein
LEFINIQGMGGNDTLVIDQSNGWVASHGPLVYNYETITFDASGGHGTLIMRGDPGGVGTQDYSANGNTAELRVTGSADGMNQLTDVSLINVATVIDTTPHAPAGLPNATVYANPNQGFVALVYQDLLGRAPEADGLAFWSGLLDKGATRQAVVLGIANSQEYRTDVVQELYQRYLKRDADLPGLTFWVGVLGSGATVEQVATGICGSSEYFQRFGGGSNDGFVGALYQDVLQRNPDPEGRLLADQALAAGYTTGQIAAVLFGSPEYQSALTRGFYERFLSRKADSDGLNYWMTQLQQGMRYEALVAGFVASDEFFNQV